MNASPNFKSILEASPSEVVRPPQIPVGTYLCTVGQWETGESSKKKTPFVKFQLTPIAAMEDVDDTALTVIGGLEGRSLSVTYYITEAAVPMLDEFHQNCGVDLTDGTSRLARNDAIMNTQVLAMVEHEIDQNDSSRVFARVNRTAMAD